MASTLTRRFVLTLTAAALVACDGAEGTAIGPEGGVVVSDDGRLTLEIPAGALDEVVDVSIHSVEDGPSGAPAIRAYAIEPMGTALVRPAHVEYDWTAEADAQALTRDGVAMHDPALVMERGEEWRALADRSVDVEAGYVSGSAHYFGIIAIVD